MVNVEKLRKELCLLELPMFLLRKKQILEEQDSIRRMLEQQEDFHRAWHNE